MFGGYVTEFTGLPYYVNDSRYYLDKESKESIIEKNELDRERRQHSRVQDNAATTIQAFYRGSSSRRLTHGFTRERFDQLCTRFSQQQGDATPDCRDQLILLIKCLNNFYLPHLDGQRIVSASSIYLSYINLLDLTQSDLTVFATAKFIASITTHLSRLQPDAASSQYTHPLRILEVVTVSSNLAVIDYLVNKNFFYNISQFLANRPLLSNGNLRDLRTHPQILSLTQLLMSPLQFSPEKHVLGFIKQTLSSTEFRPDFKSDILCAGLLDLILSSTVPLQDAYSSFLHTSPFLAALHMWTVGLSSSPKLDISHADLHILVISHSVSKLAHSGVDTEDSMCEDIASELCSDRFLRVCRKALTSQISTQLLLAVSHIFNKLCSYYLSDDSQPRLKYTLFSLTNSQNRERFLLDFWKCLTEFDRDSETGRSLVENLAKAIQPKLPSLISLGFMFSTFAHLFHPDYVGSQYLTSISALLRNILLGLLLLSHPETRHDLLTQDYQKALSALFNKTKEKQVDSAKETLQVYAQIFVSVKKLVTDLYNLDLLKNFSRDVDHWSVCGRIPPIKSLQPSYWLDREGEVSFGYYSVLNEDMSIPYLTSTERLQLAILSEAPFLIDFWDRVNLFYSLLFSVKKTMDSEHQADFFGAGIRVTARRDRVYEDAFSQLYAEENLRPRLKVMFKNELGLEEAGVDGGGLTREFLALVLSAAFDPARGFYSVTASGDLYPNPLHRDAHLDPDADKHYYFHGRMLGKLIFERFLVDLPLAPYFLKHVISCVCRDGDVSVAFDELVQLDPELHKNLMQLENLSSDDLEALELDFTAAHDRLGTSEVLELKPGGSNIRVTKDNLSEYLQRTVELRLKHDTERQTRAFARGLASLLPCSDWLSFFSHKELQLLVSGSDSPIDVSDLRNNTVYQNCSAEADTVAAFWRLMLDEFTEEQRKSVLRFATALTRTPLYGFKELQPAFTIALTDDCERLPSASTCVHLLKLPNYKDQSVLGQRLLYAVQANPGFDLS